MMDNKISPERWQALYGPVPQGFDQLVQQTLKKTREAPIMKRFTLRTALVMLICLLLLTGIALAATGVFSTKNSLDMYTSVPSNGEEVDIQTDLHQTGGDFPDLTVKVRDATFDGVTAYVTVEYKLKDPKKDMILSHWDTYGWKFANIQRWPGYSQHPLSDPKTDTRRKLVVENNGVLVYGLYNQAIADPIYESDGVLVLTWRIRMDSDRLFDAGYSWETNSGVINGDEDTFYRESAQETLQKIASNEPLSLTMIAKVQEWAGDDDGPKKDLYYCNTSITLNKTTQPISYDIQEPMQEKQIKLLHAKITFTKLATYMDIRTELPLTPDTDPINGDTLGMGLEFEWLDENGNVVPSLGCSLSGPLGAETSDGWGSEKSIFVAFWPAADVLPKAITLRAYNKYTDERLATFTIPLTNMPASPSPTLSTDKPNDGFLITQATMPSPSPAP
jgi:hypothetical protein